MNKLVFATNNSHKLYEVQQTLKNKFEVLKLSDLNFTEDIPETQSTIEGNASQKSHFIFDRFKVDCFADDTGLEIDALDGAPGVYSARYAGDSPTFEDNMNKVLELLHGQENRTACFRTVISLILGGKEYLFEGRVDGQILTEKRGLSGFGYDPIFQPHGYDQTFAEMPIKLKNQISHRGKAVKKLVEFVKSIE